MTVRPTPKHRPAARAAERTPFAASLAAVLLALVLCAFPLLAAHAEESAKPCPPGQVCQVPGISPAPVLPAPTPSETAPADPAPVIQEPAPAKPPVVTPAPVVREPAPSATPEETAAASPAPSSSMTPTPIRWTPSASATVDSAWTKPIEDATEATQAALVSDKPASGNGVFGILAIMAGVLVVGLGGLAFALWSRNRIGVH
ncbi:hypothetical protein [Arthrobacter celericrescens]|uniref:hypothetical protein n=1 Tax=Arthrobacter celericrescens TaxID=2320851 RepID=UPI000EA05D5A|nr:hypothetical protein [Arthrobacter celericrescens]